MEKKKGLKVAKKRHLLSPRDRETMMSVLIRNPVVFETFKELLQVDHFSDLDVGYALVWKTVTKFYDVYNELPDRSLLMTELESILDNSSDSLNDTERSDMEAFVDIAFDADQWKGADLTTSTKHAEWATKRLKQFLEERLALQVQETVRSQYTIVEDIPEMLEQHLQTSQQIASIQTGGSSLTFDEGWDKKTGTKLYSTGISFLDKFLGGGHAPGEAYGLLGPFGSCKTTIAVMLQVEAARYACNLVDVVGDDGRPGYAIYVSYEARLDNELRLRSLGYAAQIERASLEAMGSHGLESLGTSKNLKDYEKHMFKTALAEGKKVPGEQQRAKEAIALLNNHTLFLDMTGFDDYRKGAGGGYVEEIARIISWEMRKRGGKPVCIIIDYVGAMVKRHMAATNKDDSALTLLVGGAALRARNLLAQQFGCPVWLIHQLSGEKNEKGVGHKMHYTSAANSKSWAENLDFSLEIGMPTAESMCQLSCSKHRRTAALPNSIIRIVGHLNKVEDTNGLFMLDASKNIVSKDLVNSTGMFSKTMKKTQQQKAVVLAGSQVDDEDDTDDEKYPSGFNENFDDEDND